MSTTKKTPKLRFAGFSGEWEVKRLAEIAKKISDGIHTTPNYDDSGCYYFINGNNLINDQVIITSSTKKVNQDEFIKYKKDLDENTILMSINGTIGSLARYGNEPVILGKSACYINTQNPIQRDYIYSYLKSKSVKNYYESELTGSTIKNLSIKTIKNTVVNTPKFEEQQKIAGFLTVVDERVVAMSRKAELLEQYKKGVMQKIFSQKLRFKDEKGQDYPVWQEKKLGKLLKKNKTRNKSGQVDYVQSVSNKHGFVSQDEYFDGANISSKDTSNYFVIQKGNFAYNPSRINVGSLAYKSDSVTSIVSPLYVSFTAKGELLDGYLLPWFSNQSFIGQMRRAFEGSVRDTLSYEALSEMKLNLPCKKEQQRIANFLTSLDDKINLEKNKLEQAKLFKKSLLQRMFA